MLRFCVFIFLGLIESPPLMTHSNVPKEHRDLIGITDNFIRMSVGVENVEDLIEDLDNALMEIARK